MRPCRSLVALAQMFATPSSTRDTTVRTLASRSPPMPTTARSKSATPSCRKASVSVESAWTTCVRRSDIRWTRAAFSSTPSTSWPIRISDPATASPNRPRPTTRTVLLEAFLCLANDRALLWIAVGPVAGAERERGGDGDAAHPSDEHQADYNQLRGRRQVRRDAGRQPDRGEGRDRLEHDLVEGEVGQGEHDQSRGADHAYGEQHDGERLALDMGADAAAENRDVALAAYLRPDHQAEQEEGG